MCIRDSLWITNTDAVSPIDVSMFFKPLAQGGFYADIRRVDLTIGPGETRRFRNVVGTLLNYVGACALEVRSAAPTVSTSAVINNTPFATTTAARNAAAGITLLAGSTPTGVYGFEMRPTTPGE